MYSLTTRSPIAPAMRPMMWQTIMLAMATVRMRLLGLPTAIPATMATANPPRPKLDAINLSGVPMLNDLPSEPNHGELNHGAATAVRS